MRLGRGISSVTTYFALSDSSTTAPTSGWSTEAKTPTSSARYQWCYTLTTYTDGTTVESSAWVCSVYGTSGEKGATLRIQYWEDLATGFSFQTGGDGEDYKDVVIYNGYYYSCISSHTKTSSNYPGSSKGSTYWQLGDTVEMVATNVLLADYAKIDKLWVDDVRITDDGTTTGNVVAYMDKSGITVNTGTFNNITVESGKIAGFTISGNDLTATDGYITFTSGSDMMSLCAGLLMFTDGNSTLYFGQDTSPAVSGFSTSIRIHRTALSESYTTGHAGIYISVEGAVSGTNTVGSGDNALYIAKGCISGFRMKLRRVNASTTLSVMDSYIRTISTDEITLTLPSGAENGQVYLIRKGASGNVTIAAPSGTYIQTQYNSTANSSIVINNGDLCMLAYDSVNSLWLANVAEYDS